MKAQNLLLFIGGSAVAGASQTMTSVQANADTVTVKHSDTTWKIANEHKTTVEQIVNDNHLKNGGNLIFENQKLEVNAPGTTNNKDKATTTNQGIQSQASQSLNSIAPSQTSSTNTQSTASQNVPQTYTTPSQSTQTNPQSSTSYTSSVSGNEASAKEWIAARESGGSYTAQNASSGAYGRYQLLPGYLHGDYSPANQERVADNYVKNRYGSWSAAQSFWQAHGWY
ncbi:LysM peptidoglycan-binding domain-containing protein (plasmid) [Lactobacillus sp. PV037]|uniref:aggregation-promoting factor n=1 Tax=Lactobacillus sp. PV037 TaxID=2594496 RepID=UPI002240123E|nr:LysM peptidoglycan-binding domain-containing protein [Lactobacillus sp. PV037]QNQ82960.1 LysM peptidoglycan-binding domain-containing protein [Lactobacillus sp. PV037]